MHRVVATYLIAVVGLLAGCEEEKPQPTPRSLPEGLLNASKSTAAQKVAEVVDDRDCTPPHTGLESVTVYLGLDQLAFPLYVPTTYDAKNPPPLAVFVPDRFFEVSKWLKGAELFKKAEEAGFIVVVVHRFKSAAGSKDVQSAINSMSKQLCFDSDRVFAIGAGSGAAAVANAACEGGIAGIMTSGARVEPDCSRASFDHLHFVNTRDKTLPPGGAQGRPLSAHEKRIQQQTQAMAMGNIPMKRDILPKQDGDDDTPCSPHDGAITVEEFTTKWCAPLGCAESEPAESEGCEVREGRANLKVCRVDGGRIWPPNYAPYNSCYGEPKSGYDYMGRTFAFFDASNP